MKSKQGKQALRPALACWLLAVFAGEVAADPLAIVPSGLGAIVELIRIFQKRYLVSAFHCGVFLCRDYSMFNHSRHCFPILALEVVDVDG